MFHEVARTVRNRRVLCFEEPGRNESEILAEAGAKAVIRIRFENSVTDVADGSFDRVVALDVPDGVWSRDLVATVARVCRTEGIAFFSLRNAHFKRPLKTGVGYDYRSARETPEGLRLKTTAFFSKVSILGQEVVWGPSLHPFSERPALRSEDALAWLKSAAWRGIDRAFSRINDPVARLLKNHPFYPTEYDYCFPCEAVEGAYSLVARCRK